MDQLVLGCGGSAVPGAVNLDMVDLPGVDVVWDVDQLPWPFGDDTFDLVTAIQLFEHVADPLGFMHQAWRVLRPGGHLFLRVPSWQSEHSYTDPTHRRHCTEHTFDYWCPGTPLHHQFGEAYARGSKFERCSVATTPGGDIEALLRKVA